MSISTYLADVSEYQSNVDAPAYLQNHKSIICRVHNGLRPDLMMPVRRDYLRKYPFTAIGWYQYLSASRDAAQQANEFINTVGVLRANEFPILDIEEGSGDQTARAVTWFTIVDEWANLSSTLYSYEYFIQTQLSGAGFWEPGRPIWVAAYQTSEPAIPHTLWQESQTASFGAITPSYPVDMSLYHGSDAQFIYDVRHARSEAS